MTDEPDTGELASFTDAWLARIADVHRSPAVRARAAAELAHRAPPPPPPAPPQPRTVPLDVLRAHFAPIAAQVRAGHRRPLTLAEACDALDALIAQETPDGHP